MEKRKRRTNWEKEGENRCWKDGSETDGGGGGETVVSGATQLSINIFTVVQENTKLRVGYLGPNSARDTFHYDYVCAMDKMDC